jgi:hypothetical protein
MNKAIIEKFNLVETNIQIGQTFRYNIKVYRFKETNLLIAACNSLGEPHPQKNLLMCRDDFKNHWYVSPEFLLDMPTDELDKWVIAVNKVPNVQECDATKA